MLRNLENRGNPWGVGGNVREDWIKELDFEVRMADGPLDYDIEYLFWVGCAGAIDDRAKKVTKAVAELLHIAGVEFAVLGYGRDLLGRPGPPHGQRVRLPAAGHGERRDAQRRLRGPRAGHAQDRRHLPALLQLARPGVPAARRRVRGRPPHPAARPAGRGGPAHPGHAGRPQGDLPRPVLPRPAQQGLHAPARDPRLRPGPLHAGDAPLQGPRLLLRRRRRPHVDGGEDRQADQRRAHRGGARARSRRHLHRLPVLHHDAERRADHEEAERRGRASTSRSSTSARSCCARWRRSAGARARSPAPRSARRPTTSPARLRGHGARPDARAPDDGARPAGDARRRRSCTAAGAAAAAGDRARPTGPTQVRDAVRGRPGHGAPRRPARRLGRARRATWCSPTSPGSRPTA